MIRSRGSNKEEDPRSTVWILDILYSLCCWVSLYFFVCLQLFTSFLKRRHCITFVLRTWVGLQLEHQALSHPLNPSRPARNPNDHSGKSLPSSSMGCTVVPIQIWDFRQFMQRTCMFMLGKPLHADSFSNREPNKSITEDPYKSICVDKWINNVETKRSQVARQLASPAGADEENKVMMKQETDKRSVETQGQRLDHER